MFKLDQKLSVALVSIAGVLVSTSAWAVAIDVPEPGMTGMVAVGVVAVLVAARLRNRK